MSDHESESDADSVSVSFALAFSQSMPDWSHHLCEGANQREVARITLRWWDQSGIDWEKAKAKETETESASDLDSGSDTEGGEVRETESRESGYPVTRLWPM